jgi:hypothetical protein
MNVVLFILALISAGGFANSWAMNATTVQQQTVAWLGMGFSATCFCICIAAIAVRNAIEDRAPKG